MDVVLDAGMIKPSSAFYGSSRCRNIRIGIVSERWVVGERSVSQIFDFSWKLGSRSSGYGCVVHTVANGSKAHPN